MDSIIDKNKVRASVKANLAKRTLGKDDKIHKSLYRQLFALPQWKNANTIATTLSKRPELSTKPILKRAWQEHKTVVVPKINKKQMAFHVITSHTKLTTDKFGIREPTGSKVIGGSLIDMIICPGIGFSTQGQKHYRLGFGGGYYDKFLMYYDGFTVALALPQETFDYPIWGTEAYDVPVDKVICEKNN